MNTNTATMLRGIRRRNAFTLVEVVTVVIILALLGAVAMPVYLDYRHDAKLASEEAVVGRIKLAIQSVGMRNAIDNVPRFPASLDDASPNSLASGSNPFFKNVLNSPVTDGWQKGGTANKYLSPLEHAYAYDSVSGTFTLQSGDTGSSGTADGDATGETEPSADPGDGELSREDIEALRGSDIIDANLTPEQISWLTDEQLATLTPEELASLTQEQIKALTAEQIAALDYDQFEALATSLTPEQISQATPQQIAMLSAETYGDLNDEQRAALTQAQLDEVAHAANIRTLDWRDIRNLDPYDVKYLSAEQIAAIPSNYEMSRIPEELREAFTRRQIQALDTGNVSIGYLSESQRELLTTEQIESLGSYRDIRYVPESRAAEVTPDLIATIPSSYEMSRIPEEVRAAFTESQVQALNTADVSIGYLSETQRELLTTAQIESLGRYGDIRYVPASRASEVTADLIATIPSSYEMSRIPGEVIAGFTESQVQALNTTDVSIGYLTAAQREQLTTAQIESMGRYSDIRYVPTSRASEVSADLLATIPSSYEMGRIPDDVIAAFSESQVQALNTENVSISYLTEAQREQLTTAQIESMGSFQDIRYVPTTRASEVSTDLIATIPSSYEMSRIPGEVRAAFTQTQVQAIDTGSVSIGYLTASQREQLTTTQISSLGSFQDIRYVPASSVSSVTTSLVASIPSTYEFNRIPTETVQAMTQEQVLAISSAYYDSIKSRLTDEQQSWRP